MNNDELSAGREMDALVVERVGLVWDEARCRVCGWPLINADLMSSSVGCTVDSCAQRPKPARRADEPALYSTDIAAAWQVVAAMEARGYWCRMQTPFRPGDSYRAGFTLHGVSGWNGRPDHWTAAETLPLAICCAALKAIEAADDTR